jgi:hypothetical protein
VTDDDWEHRRDRAIMATIQTGRAVFADTDGELRYADGNREPLADDIGVVEAPAVASLASAERWSRRAFVWSIVAAIANTGMAYWHLWQLALACVCLFSAFGWYRVNRTQCAILRRTMQTTLTAYFTNRDLTARSVVWKDEEP